MEYYERLALFFKSKGVSQIEVGKKLGYSKSSMSKFLNGNSVIDSSFIVKMVREFPDVDLKYIFSDQETENNMVMEPNENYGLNPDNVDKELEIIMERITEIRKVLAQKCHKN